MFLDHILPWWCWCILDPSSAQNCSRSRTEGSSSLQSCWQWDSGREHVVPMWCQANKLPAPWLVVYSGCSCPTGFVRYQNRCVHPREFAILLNGMVTTIGVQSHQRGDTIHKHMIYMLGFLACRNIQELCTLLLLIAIISTSSECSTEFHKECHLY